MTLTEEEAKTKWCPFARTPSYGEKGATNRNMHGESLSTSRCIASACMAWQFTGESFDGKTGTAAPCGRCGLAS